MKYEVIVKNKNEETKIHAESGVRLGDALLSAGFALPFDCSGRGICGKCRVYAPEAQISDTDKRLLGKKELSQGIRLACGVEICDNIEVRLIESGEYSAVKSVAFESGEIISGSVGIAADIGTTTLALYAVDNSDGKIKGSVCRKNAQSKYGADVISRIAFCRGEGKTDLLHKTVMRQIDDMITELCEKYQLKSGAVNKIVFAGNTVMLHLLMNKSPLSLGVSPYTPEFLESVECMSDDLGLKAVSGVKSVLMPGVSAFVGADITAAVLCSGMLGSRKTQLLIDIGTNAETVLCTQGKYYACSASAGPALEGAGISCGMCACEGAIKKVEFLSGGFVCQVIGGKAAVGICGSGLISAVALLLNLGVIRKDGGISCDEAFEDFVFERDGVFGVWLTREVVLTSEDIRAVMLAKGAVAAGIKTLLEYAGKSVSEIESLYIAGSFGANMDINDAVKIGLIPGELKSKAVQTGNAAGIGAAMVCFDKASLEKAGRFARECESVNLSLERSFEDRFIKELNF